MSPSGWILAVLLLYGLALLVIGVWGGRESTDVAGYYVAGKKLPSWVIAFSTNATGESAWLLLGLTGMGYAVGFHALWVVLGEVLGVTLGWVLVALPFKEYTDRYGAITVPDYLEARFRDTRRVFQLIGLAVILTMVTAYTAAQLTAMGKAFGAFSGTTYAAGVLIGAAIVLFYTTVGGFKAVAYSDLLQGVIMFLALLVLPFVGFAAAGGWHAVIENLRAQDPALLTVMGERGQVLVHFRAQSGGKLAASVVVFRARLGGDREPAGYRKPDVGHLRQPGPFAPEQFLLRAASFGPAAAEEVDVLHSPCLWSRSLGR